MSTEITQVKNGLVRIKWRTSIVREGLTDPVRGGSELHLGSFSYYPCLSVKRMPIKETTINPTNEVKAEFKVSIIILMRVTSHDSCCQFNSGARGIIPAEEYYKQQSQPTSIWVSINGGKNRFLSKFYKTKAASEDNSWVDQSSVKTIFESTGFPLTAVCLLWFKFPTFNQNGQKALQDFSGLFNQQKYCDVQFCLKDGDVDEQIGGHAIILSARSPVFAAMFQHEMKESKTRRVNILDIRPEILKKLLQFIYSGQIATLTEDTAQPLFVVADKYDIDDLKEECVAFILSCIRMENVVSLMVWANLYSIKELKDATLAFVADNGQEICMQSDWEELTKSYPDLCILATRRMMASVKSASS